MTRPHCTKGTWVDSNGAARRCYACRGTGVIVAPAPTAPSSPTRPSGEPNEYAHGDVDDTTAREEPSDDEIYNGHGMEGGIAYDTGRGDA